MALQGQQQGHFPAPLLATIALSQRMALRQGQDHATVSWIIQMIGWGLDTISEELMWALVVVGVIAAIAVVSLLRKY
jgi:hypothetical protein